MEYRPIGNSGIRVSTVSLGSWLTFGHTVAESETRRCVAAALDAGINFFDTADVYANGEAEIVLGRALAEIPRSRAVIATKCFFPTGAGPNERGLSRKHIFDACHASLRRLGSDYIDLYQCHRFDPDVPLYETADAMTSLIRSGKVLYWGFSQWPSAAIDEVMKISGVIAPISDQARYSALDREIEGDVMAACRRYGLGILAYSPLAQGVLTGKYRSGAKPAESRAAHSETASAIEWRLDPGHLEKADRLAQIAGPLGVPLSTMALAWCLREPVVASVITGASRAEQIVENANAAAVHLTQETIDQIEQVLK